MWYAAPRWSRDDIRGQGHSFTALAALLTAPREAARHRSPAPTIVSLDAPSGLSCVTRFSRYPNLRKEQERSLTTSASVVGLVPGTPSRRFTSIARQTHDAVSLSPCQNPGQGTYPTTESGDVGSPSPGTPSPGGPNATR